MTEIKNVEQELSRFQARLVAAAAFVMVCFGLLGYRLYHLQIEKHDELSVRAENNRISVVPIVPNRGLIVDRNGVVLANNYSAYTLEIMPARVHDLESTINRLAELVDIQTRDRKRFTGKVAAGRRAVTSWRVRERFEGARSGSGAARRTAANACRPAVLV